MLTINHVFVTSFPKFRRAVDELGCVYRIENTLTENVSPKAMLAIAEQTQPVVHGAAAPLPTATVRNVNLPARTTAAVSQAAKIGALLGFLGISVVALLSLLVLARQRELNGLRDQVAFALAVEARERPFAAAGIAAAQPRRSGIPDARPAPLNVPDAQPAPTAPTDHRTE